MPVFADPEGVSIKIIQEFIDITDKRIFEIGCGKGRITMGIAAINQAVAEGFLKSDQSIMFEYFIRAESFHTLSKWLAEDWPSEYIPDDTRRKVMEMESEAGEHAEVILRIASCLNLFRATN